MELDINKRKKKSTTMMTLSSNSNSNSSPDYQNPSDEPITASTCPTWKLYENPFYNSHQNHQYHHHHHHLHQSHHQNQTVHQSQQQSHCLAKNLQFLHLPLSARKLAASFWDLTFFRPVAMDASELEPQRPHGGAAAELRAELECERRARKKLEGANRRLAKELAEERRARESMQRMCEELAREVSADKAEMARVRREIEEERKMMRMSEVLREERVQMKLADAKIALEERLSELDLIQLGSKASTTTAPKPAPTGNNLSWKFRHFVLGDKFSAPSSTTTSSSSPPTTVVGNNAARVDSMESMRSVFSGTKSLSMSDHHHHHHDHQYKCNENVVSNNNGNNNNNNNNVSVGASLPIFQRKLVSPETENPHIKRGIKGFVEFPRVVKSIGTRNRQWGTKLECQKAQLRILLKQKSPIRSSNNLIMS